MEYKCNRSKKQSIWFIVSLLFLITFQAHAITTFTANGEKSLTVDREEKVDVTFKADTVSPGGSLTLEIYPDFRGDGKIDPEDMIVWNFEKLVVTDGVKDDWVGDEDGEANSHIATTINMAEGPFESLLFPHIIIRAVDEDGSSDSVAIHIKMPKAGQTVSGRVTDEDGMPIENVPVIGTSALFKWPPTLCADVTNADGEYVLFLDANMVAVELGEKRGYYSESPVQHFHLAEGEHKTDVNFVLKVDVTPPTIQHEPPEGAIINNSLLLEAVIEDKDSGTGFLNDVEEIFKPFDFSISPEGAIPRVYFRAKGSAEYFTMMVMYPKYDIEFPEPLLPIPEFDEAGDEDDEVVAVKPGEDVGPDGSPIFRHENRYQLLIPGMHITPAGLEYYIETSDRAHNIATSPPGAPNILHEAQAKTAPYVISGIVGRPDGTGVAGVEIYARTADVFAGGTDIKGFSDMANAKTDEYGKYHLFLTVPGRWHLSILIPPKSYILSPKEVVQIVHVEEEKEYSGCNWIIAEDNQLPVIEHNPDTDVTASSVGEDVIIKANIHDDSGIAYAHVVIVSELEFGYEYVDIGFADIIAPPKPGEDALYTFVIPAYRVTKDVKYFIKGFDRVGNIATHPADNPKENPHSIKIKPALHTIYGKVTVDGEGLGYVPITAESDTNTYNKTMTKRDGTFSVFVGKGTWKIQPHAYGYFVVNSIEPVVIEAEGQYEVNIELTRDKKPPVILHNPATDVTASSAGEDVTIKTTITDETNVFARIVIVSGISQPFDGYEWGIDDAIPSEIRSDVEYVNPGVPQEATVENVENILPPDTIWWDWRVKPDINGDVYTFVICGDVVAGDISYFIEARDSSGNVATHPAERPKEIPHLIKIEPAPHSIVGKVTLETDDGEGLSSVVITATSDAGDYRKTMTTEDGTFILPVKLGTWEIAAFMFGMASVEPIEPVLVEDEGEYEVDIALAKDTKPPIIIHTPLEKLVFGETTTITVSVADDGEMDVVLIRILLDDEEIPLKAHPTPDGMYVANLFDIFPQYLLGKTTEIQYKVEATDVAGNSAVGETYSAPLEIPYTISGKVTVDGQQQAGVRIFFANDAVKSHTETEADGSYSIPATLGKNTVMVERGQGYVVTDGSLLEREIDVQPDKQYTDVNFELKWTGKVDRDDGELAGEEELKEGWSRVDVISDQIIDIADVVFIGKHFGEKIENHPETAPNPDVNGDGVVDISDLVLVAKRFGETLSASNR